MFSIKKGSYSTVKISEQKIKKGCWIQKLVIEMFWFYFRSRRSSCTDCLRPSEAATLCKIREKIIKITKRSYENDTGNTRYVPWRGGGVKQLFSKRFSRWPDRRNWRDLCPPCLTIRPSSSEGRKSRAYSHCFFLVGREFERDPYRKSQKPSYERVRARSRARVCMVWMGPQRLRG